MIYDSILDTIGRTPVVRLNAMAKGLRSEVLVKVESKNPSGSIKDRAALSMVEAAEESGMLVKGGTVIEPTSGNTGIGIAMVAAARGYKAVLVMPDTMSRERVAMMSAYGAEIVLTPGSGGMFAAVDTANEIARERGGIVLGQFDNPANPESHRLHTALEIYDDVPDVDYVVVGIGTGGTATGIAKGLMELGSEAVVIGVEPEESPLLTDGKTGEHGIQGIGANFIPVNYDSDYVKRIMTVSTEKSKKTAVRLAREEGISAGISAGAAVAAAIEIAGAEEGKRILAILPDGGDRYISGGLYDEE